MERGSGSLIKIWKRIHMDLKVNLSVPTEEILTGLLEMNEAEIEKLKNTNVIQ